MKRCPKCGSSFPDEANFCPEDAGRLVPDTPAEAENSEALLGGRFTLGEAIGGGRTGKVFQATDSQSKSSCVVKKILPDLFAEPAARQRAERELQQLSGVDAPGVANIIAHGNENGQLWVAMQQVGGKPLSELVAHGAVEPMRAGRILLAIAKAVAAASKQGVVHHDLAAKNVLVGEGDSVGIINFTTPVPGTDIRGVAEFASPELIEGNPWINSLTSILLAFCITRCSQGILPTSGRGRTY